MKLQKILIENLRGIRFLSCDRLAPITLIGGRNNSGKSTFLEAVKLLSGRRDASVAPDINLLTRQINLSGKQDIQVLFNDPERPIDICATMDKDVVCKLRLSLDKSSGGEWNPSSGASNIAMEETNWRLSQHGEDSVGNLSQGRWDTELEPRVDDKGHLRFSYTHENEAVATEWKCTLLAANTRSYRSRIEVFSRMTIDQKDRELSSTLQKIYPDIFTVKLVNDVLMVKVRGSEKLLPAKASGDGVVRMISVLSNLWDCSGGCLCVDEIDNGLHYSVLLDFWRAIADFVDKFNVQLIATTHHLEMLETLNIMVKEKKRPELAEYIRLTDNKSGGHKVDVFEGTDLDRALQLGLELRG